MCYFCDSADFPRYIMKRVVFLLFAGLLLALLAPTVQTAYGADDVKKGRKTYTVNEEHIRRQEAEKAAP